MGPPAGKRLWVSSCPSSIQPTGESGACPLTVRPSLRREPIRKANERRAAAGVDGDGVSQRPVGGDGVGNLASGGLAPQ